VESVTLTCHEAGTGGNQAALGPLGPSCSGRPSDEPWGELGRQTPSDGLGRAAVSQRSPASRVPSNRFQSGYCWSTWPRYWIRLTEEEAERLRVIVHALRNRIAVQGSLP
jgi:hypothetical protein